MSSALLGSLLPLAVAIPLTAAALAPLLARVTRYAPLVVSAAALIGSGVICLLEAPQVYRGHVISHFMGHVYPVHGDALGIAFGADAWGLTFALVTSFLGALLAIYTLSELGDLGPRELGRYAALFLALCGALIGSALTADLFNLFVWFEVAALASYALTAFFLERPIALEAAFKVLVLTTMASFAIFLAASLIYSAHGALDFAQIHDALARHTGSVDLVALGLLFGGFATKAGLVPFHGWLPDAHTAAPGPVSALFSGLMVNLGIVAIGRIALQVYTPAVGHHLLGLMTAVGLVSAVGGAGFALLQDDLKRLLAYDTISQMGVLLVGLGSGTAGGMAGASYHLIDHALFKSLLFLCAGAIVHMTGATKLSEMGGLARRYPVVAGAFVIGVLAIAGVPPLNGYVSLGLIHDSLLRSHNYVAYAVMLIAQVLTIAALGKAGWQAFFARRTDGDFERDEKLKPGMRISLFLLAGGCIAFGVLPNEVLTHLAAPAAGALMSPGAYARAVLASGGRVPIAHVSFDYVSWSDLVAVAGSCLLAVPLALAAMRRGESRLVAIIRSVQSGSVNDYAAYLVLGLLTSVACMAL